MLIIFARLATCKLPKKIKKMKKQKIHTATEQQ